MTILVKLYMKGKLKSSPENDQQKIQVPEGYVGELGQVCRDHFLFQLNMREILRPAMKKRS